MVDLLDLLQQQTQLTVEIKADSYEEALDEAEKYKIKLDGADWNTTHIGFDTNIVKEN